MYANVTWLNIYSVQNAFILTLLFQGNEVMGRKEKCKKVKFYYFHLMYMEYFLLSVKFNKIRVQDLWRSLRRRHTKGAKNDRNLTFKFYLMRFTETTTTKSLFSPIKRHRFHFQTQSLKCFCVWNVFWFSPSGEIHQKNEQEREKNIQPAILRVYGTLTPQIFKCVEKNVWTKFVEALIKMRENFISPRHFNGSSSNFCESGQLLAANLQSVWLRRVFFVNRSMESRE